MVAFEEFTDFGSREKNEDTCGSACHGESLCFVVADGLGGHGGGEVASQIAVNTVCEIFVKEGWSEQFFENVFTKVQRRILKEQEIQHAPSRMKTTLVVLVIHDKKAHWAHIGDSRLYFFKNGKIKKRTLDHSVPQMLALSGEIKELEIRHHPDRNRLMRVMGIRGDVPRYEVGSPVKLAGNQAFLLCTDGYWELIEEKHMEQSLAQSKSVKEWIGQMNKIILQNGKDVEMDNFTCIGVSSIQKGLFGGHK